MKPEVAKCWDEACATLRGAEIALDEGSSTSVQKLCQSAVMFGCFTIKIGGFGDAGATLFDVCEEVMKVGRNEAIEKASDTLNALRQMVPPENFLPEVP